LKGGENMRTEWIPRGEMVHILASLSPENRLACEISLATGLRINDVLALTPQKVRKQRFTIREEKTGKTRLIRLPSELVKRALACSGQHYIFEGRLNGRTHRTRQAVYKDLKKASANFSVRSNIAPHTLRKIYAVDEFERTGGNLKKVKKLLNHTSEAVTMLYAMANVIGKRKRFEKVKK
jgi:integrase